MSAAQDLSGASDDEGFVTIAETDRLGEEAARCLGRKITREELEQLFDEVETLRIHQGLLQLWEQGLIVFAVRGGEVVSIATEYAR